MKRQLFLVASVLLTGYVASLCLGRNRLPRMNRAMEDPMTIPSQKVRPLLQWPKTVSIAKSQ